MRIGIVCALGAVVAVSFGGFSGAAIVGSDNASNYANWTTGSNGGSGFGAWELLTSGANGTDAFAGHFLAVNPGDLNFIGSPPDNRAWGAFANDSSPNNSSSDTLQSAGAFRSFTGGALEIGQSFVVRMEHGFIDDQGSLNPNAIPNVGNLGFAGIMLNPFPSNGANPLTPFGEAAGPFGFGFVGGDTVYRVYDGLTPSGRPFDAGLGFTTDGLEITWTAVSSSTYSLSVRNLANNQLFSQTFNGDLTGITNFGLYNRNTELADVFFNSVAVVPEPTTALLVAPLMAVFARRRRA
jgi:hypothetical protein